MNIKNLAILTVLLITNTLMAQKVAVTWKFTAKKINATNYEVAMQATVPKGWHIYSQFTGDGPVATNFKYNKNALLTITGKVKETGKLIAVKDDIWKNTQKYFANTVTFTQVIKLNSTIKTNLSGAVEYMICDETNCLPPTTQKFNITL